MDLTNEQWQRIAKLIPKSKAQPGKSGRPPQDLREVLNGILWILRTGAPWSDLPKRYPPQSTCHRRFQQWAAKEFDEAAGQANFLGTINPVAAKLYAKLGWRYLVGTQVMARIGSGKAPEEFLVDYFRNGQDLPVRIEVGSPLIG